ncbi:non-histone protein [Gaertneriomyces sp. JEL0708]|nr:non-histone protein [Gaertneriomyces sp. JEL0708]
MADNTTNGAAAGTAVPKALSKRFRKDKDGSLKKFFESDIGSQLFLHLTRQAEAQTFISNFIQDVLPTYLRRQDPTPPTARELKKIKREARDPDQPKRPNSAYIIFSKAIRPQLKEEMPELTNKGLISEIGKRWTALSETERAPYEEEASEERAKYDVKKKAWVDGKTKEGEIILERSSGADDKDDDETDTESEAEEVPKPALPSQKLDKKSKPSAQKTTKSAAAEATEKKLKKDKAANGKATPVSAKITATPAKTPASAPAPGTPTPSKKDKKRKAGDLEPAEAVTPAPGSEKKKRKKRKSLGESVAPATPAVSGDQSAKKPKSTRPKTRSSKD